MNWTKSLALTLLLVISSSASTWSQQFDILDGKEKVELPFQYVHNFLLVEVRLFGLLPMNFIFDTGAEHSILFKRSYADIFNVEYDLRIPILGADLSRELYAMVARQIDIEVLGLRPLQRDILVLEENFFQLDEITGTQIHGILGGSFFKNVIVHIDYRKRKITLINPLHFKEPPNAYQRMDVHIRSNKPYVQGLITLMDDTELGLELLVDTGAGLPLLLHNNSHEELRLPDTYILGKLGMGLGGYVEGYIGRIKGVQIANTTLDFVLTSFQDVSNSVLEDTTRFRNGLIGNEILNRFDIYIDYVKEQVYIKPARRYKRKFKMDKSGLIIFALGQNLNEYVVQDTIRNSPAAEADIRPGDIIKRIQGLPSGLFSLDHIAGVLQRRNGKKIRLVIKRKQELIKKSFRLRDLV